VELGSVIVHAIDRRRFLRIASSVLTAPLAVEAQQAGKLYRIGYLGPSSAIAVSREVHVILDNYGTHKTPLIHRWLVRHPRYHVHFTPTGASWINLVERWFATLTDKQVRCGDHRSTRELDAAIARYIDVTNKRPRPFVWTKTADEILASMARFCHRISNSRH